MYDCIRRVFATLFIPLACWQVWIFPAVPNYYLQHFLIYPCLFFLAYAAVCRQWTWQKLHKRWLWLCPWLLTLLCAQVIALWLNAPTFLPQQSHLAVVLTGLGKLLVQLPFIIVFVEILGLLLRDEQGRTYFMRGVLAAFIALFCWCAVQALTIFTHGATQPALVVLHDVLASLLRAVSPWLEARWLDTVIPMYRDHAYALTEGRINGFFEEASTLATWLGLFFLPLGLAGCAAVQYTAQQNSAKNCTLLSRKASIFLLLGSLFLLLLCRSSTGIVLCAVGIFLTLCLLLPRSSSKIRYATLASLACLILLALCLTSLGQKTAWQLLAGKSNRFAVTQTSAIMTIQHPLLGLGRGIFSPAYVAYSPLSPQDRGEIRTWKEQKSVPHLCSWLALSAEYGIPAVLCLIWACFSLWQRLRRTYRQQPSPETLFWYSTSTAFFCLLGIAMCAIVEIRNPFAHTLLIALYLRTQEENIKNT
jgi:hypothetical protein